MYLCINEICYFYMRKYEACLNMTQKFDVGIVIGYTLEVLMSWW